MKHLYLIGGTMGVGKTTTCQILKHKLDNCVFLDGDWCWDAYPFHVTDETKTMVMDNICYILNNFIHCSAYENIIFCWVMHDQNIIDNILSRLDTSMCVIRCISLVCSVRALKQRLENDIEQGVREKNIVELSVKRLALYENLRTEKIDVSMMSPEQVAEKIYKNNDIKYKDDDNLKVRNAENMIEG